MWHRTPRTHPPNPAAPSPGQVPPPLAVCMRADLEVCGSRAPTLTTTTRLLQVLRHRCKERRCEGLRLYDVYNRPRRRRARFRLIGVSSSGDFFPFHFFYTEYYFLSINGIFMLFFFRLKFFFSLSLPGFSCGWRCSYVSASINHSHLVPRRSFISCARGDPYTPTAFRIRYGVPSCHLPGGFPWVTHFISASLSVLPIVDCA